MKQHLKAGLLGVVGAATRRHAVLLARDARAEDGILTVRTRYRAEGDRLDCHIEDSMHGTLRAELAVNATRVWSSPAFHYEGPGTLTLDLNAGTVQWNGTAAGFVGTAPFRPRRFIWDFELEAEDGSRRARRTGHYVPRDASRGIDAEYYAGEDYVDYESQSEAVHADVLRLLRAADASGPVLEVGSATGGTLAALRAAGFDGVGLEGSGWATARAADRLGPGVVWQCEVGTDALPDAVTTRAPFGALVLASVFEHLGDPFVVLGSLTPLVRTGGTLVMLTTNADSLTHRLFGSDWEGYFDWSHKGVDVVSAESLRHRLPSIGWRVRTLQTWHIWDSDADPTKATLRQWWESDARFRRLIVERDLGDFIAVVAERA